MTRDDLIERIARRTKMSRSQAENLVCTIFGTMEQSLRQGERIEIRGFGTFQVRSYKGYHGRNPKTGNPVEVPPKRLPFFKVSKNLAAEVNVGPAKNLERVHQKDLPGLGVAARELPGGVPRFSRTPEESLARRADNPRLRNPAY